MKKIAITPKKAQELLDTVQSGWQRKLKQTVVKKYAIDMVNGDWHDIAQPILISQEGYLIDGQHRCAAIIVSGVTVETYIASGIEKQSIHAVDRGASRTIRDVLILHGYSSTGNKVGELARLAFLIEGKSHISDSQILRRIEKHPSYEIVCTEFFPSNIRGVSIAPVRLAMAEMFERNEPKARDFASRIMSCNFTFEKDPAACLFRVLIRNTFHGERRIECYGKSVAAMQADLDNRKISKLYKGEWK